MASTKKRRKPASQRKEEIVRIRLTAEQKTALSEAATKMGLGLSSWLLNLGLRELQTLEKA